MGAYRAVFAFAGAGFWAVVAWAFGFTPAQIGISAALAFVALTALSGLLAPVAERQGIFSSGPRR